MAIINLLPSSLKHTKHVSDKKTTSDRPSPLPSVPIPKNRIANIALVATIVMALALAGFWNKQFLEVKASEKDLASLEKKVEKLKSVYTVTDELTQKKKGLDETAGIYKELLQNNVAWSEKLDSIYKALPPQIWLTDISVETQNIKVALVKPEKAEKETVKTSDKKTKAEKKSKATEAKKQEQIIIKTLVIKGSATSLVESDIVSSVTQFLENLKRRSTFSQDFAEIKLGPLNSVKKGAFNIMNFSLFCKFK